MWNSECEVQREQQSVLLCVLVSCGGFFKEMPYLSSLGGQVVLYSNKMQ